MTAFFEHSPTQDRQVIHIAVRKSTLYALLVSLLLHVLILSFLQPWKQPITSEIQHQPFSVSLVAKQQTTPTPIESPAQSPPVLPEKPQSQPKKAIKQTPKPPREAVVAPVQTIEKPAYIIPERVQAPVKELSKQTNEPDSPPTDMQSYIAAQRAKRAAAQGVTSDIWQESPQNQALSDDAKRDVLIQRNLQMGVNGLFQIVNMSEQHAQFTFKGWRNSISSAKQELIQVEAAPGEDIQRAVVRRMITLIRRYHQQDFNWESQRLGRVVVLSARPADTAGLEEFLIAEFFTTNGRSFN